MDRISVVLISNRLEHHLEHILNDLSNQTAPSDLFELVVVNDGLNNDNLRARLQSENLRFSTSFLHVGRKGIPFCRNRGLELASHNLIGFWDDNAYYPTDWVETALDMFRYLPEIHVVCGMIRAKNSRHPLSKLRQRIFYPTIMSLDYNRSGTTTQTFVPYAHGGNSVYRSEVFDEFGQFDETLPGFVDVEMGYRLRGEQKIAFCPSLYAYHQHIVDWGQYYLRSFNLAEAAWAFNSRYPDYDDTIPYLLKLPGHSLLHYCLIAPAIYYSKSKDVGPLELLLLYLQHLLHALGIVYYAIRPLN